MRAVFCFPGSTLLCFLLCKAVRVSCFLLFAVGGVVFQEGIKKRFFVALSFLSH